MSREQLSTNNNKVLEEDLPRRTWAEGVYDTFCGAGGISLDVMIGLYVFPVRPDIAIGWWTIHRGVGAIHVVTERCCKGTWSLLPDSTTDVKDRIFKKYPGLKPKATEDTSLLGDDPESAEAPAQVAPMEASATNRKRDVVLTKNDFIHGEGIICNLTARATESVVLLPPYLALSCLALCCDCWEQFIYCCRGGECITIGLTESYLFNRIYFPSSTRTLSCIFDPVRVLGSRQNIPGSLLALEEAPQTSSSLGAPK